MGVCIARAPDGSRATSARNDPAALSKPLDLQTKSKKFSVGQVALSLVKDLLGGDLDVLGVAARFLGSGRREIRLRFRQSFAETRRGRSSSSYCQVQAEPRSL